MKKKAFIIILLVVLLIVAESIILWWISPRYFLKNANEIKCIEIFNGSTGKIFQVTDADKIQHIVSGIQGTKFKKSSISENIDGFAFRLTFYDDNGKTVDSFIVNSDSKIRNDPFFYETEKDMNIFAFIQELENNI